MANAKKSKKRVAVKDLKPTNVGKVKGGDTATDRPQISSFTISKDIDKATP